MRRVRDFYIYFRKAEYPNGRLRSLWSALTYLRWSRRRYR